MLAPVSGLRNTHYFAMQGSVVKREREDICTRSLNNYDKRDEGVDWTHIRFDYSTRWHWTRAHVLFLRALFRGIKAPKSIIRQITVPRLNDEDKGVSFNVRRFTGREILLMHSLIRDVHEDPRLYQRAYYLWRNGYNAVAAYNTAGRWGIVRTRSGYIWHKQEYTESQAIYNNQRKLTTLADVSGGPVYAKHPMMRSPGGWLSDVMPRNTKTKPTIKASGVGKWVGHFSSDHFKH